MVGEAPAHNEATGRDLYASLIGWPPVGPPVSAGGEAETRAVSKGLRAARRTPFEAWVGKRWYPMLVLEGLEAPVPAEGRTSDGILDLVSTCRSIQAVAPQQLELLFDHHVSAGEHARRNCEAKGFGSLVRA